MNFTYDATMFRETFEHEFTYINGFMRNVNRSPNAPALHCPLTKRRWSYSQLNEEVNRLANAMLADGVQKNDVVMYMLLNSAEFIFSYLAAHKINAISCPVNFRQAPGEVALVIDDSQPKVFIYDQEFESLAKEALRLAHHKPKRVIVADLHNEAQGGEGHIPYRCYRKQASVENPVLTEKPHIYDEAVRLYTSGTTNRPKGVPINIINEVLSAHDVLMHFPLNSTDKTMNMTPWFHRGGLHSGGPNPTLYCGGEVVILRHFKPSVCLSYAERFQITFLIGVPSVIAMLAKAQEKKLADLSRLRGIVTMGAPFEKSACEKYMKLLTPNIFNGYGTTESFWNTFLRPYNLPEMSGTAGQCCTDDEVRIVTATEDGRSEPEDLVAKDGKAVGEIIIKSPAKSSYCYFNNEEMTKKKFYKGYLYTGDLGTWDENEFITVVGRKDDMIVSTGENIYPTQIEEILNEHPKVEEAAAIGVPDRVRGQVVAAYVVPGDKSLTKKELKEYCMNHPMLSPYKRPKEFHFVQELPHTATGKLMHYKLREQSKEKE